MADAEKMEDIRKFWNDRAALGETACTQDGIAKQLEIREILKYVRDGQRILDVGCGNGITAIDIAKRYDVEVVGFDFAPDLVLAANERASAAGQLVGSVAFAIGDMLKPLEIDGEFDLIITERAIINLPDWKLQAQAITNIVGHLASGGTFLMCENCQDSLGRLNELRKNLGLKPITPPWHNCYLLEQNVSRLSIPGVRLAEVNDFTSTYYFLSRVINASLASADGVEPSYDAPINKLALELPPFGNVGQVMCWVLQRD